MKRFLMSALSAATLTLAPIAAHAAPEGSEALFLFRLHEYLLDEGMSLHYKVVTRNPSLALKSGQLYCRAKASGMSLEEFADANARSIIKVADDKSDIDFLVQLTGALTGAADIYLCPGLEERNPSLETKYIGS